MLLGPYIGYSLRHTRSIIPNAHISVFSFSICTPPLRSSGAFHRNVPPNAVVVVVTLAIV